MSTVLIVDDGADMRALVGELLRIHGYDPIEASSGCEALEMLATGTRPDLIVLDVQMPGLDGWDTLMRIRTSRVIGDIPVIMCTVKNGELDTALAWELGCDAYVAKPFAIGTLLREIDFALARTPNERSMRRREILSAIARA